MVCYSHNQHNNIFSRFYDYDDLEFTTPNYKIDYPVGVFTYSIYYYILGKIVFSQLYVDIP